MRYRSNSFTRGSEIWMHQARLFIAASKIVLISAVIFGVIVGVFYFYISTSAVEKYGLQKHIIAQAKDILPGYKTTPMELSINHSIQLFLPNQVISMTSELAENGLHKFHNAIVLGVLSAIVWILTLITYWYMYGKNKLADRQIRGSQVVSGQELANHLKKRKEAGSYSIAGVPMRKKSETLHILIGGAQGTGKSQQFFALMKQVRANGKRMIVYDPTGEFTQAFYREGKDIIMNPLDERSPNWNVWAEIEKDYHFDNLANGLIPDPAESDPFWARAARMVLKDVYKVLGQEGRRTNKDLYHAIAKSNLTEMHALLHGTAGATYVDPITERTGMSVKMTVQNQLEAFRFLHDDGDPFSIRKWVHQDSDSWMFITARESMREALKPILSLWIDIAIKAVLDLPPLHQERLWFSIDELPTLQKLDILKLALTNTRKHGLCMALGVQDFSQLYEIYGRELAKTIISGCQTKLLLRVTDGAAAKLLSDLMGQAEIDEKDETLSYGAHAQRDGVSINGRRALRNVVLTSEILALPDMAGYLVIPGDYPIAKVGYSFVPTQKIAEGFIEKQGFCVDFEPSSDANEQGGSSVIQKYDAHPLENIL